MSASILRSCLVAGGTMAHEIAARAAMKHRRMAGGDAGIARLQAQVDDTAPIIVVFVERIARQFHRPGFEIRKQVPEIDRLLRQIAVDVAERCIDFVHDVDAVFDEAGGHAGLQQDESRADFLHERTCRVSQDKIVRYEDVAELHAVGTGPVHRKERLARLQGDAGVGTIGKEHHDAAGLVLALENGAEEMAGPEIRHPGQRTLD
jgi:hypothetical protein